MTYTKPKHGDLVTQLKNGRWVKVPKNSNTKLQGIMGVGIPMTNNKEKMQNVCIVKGVVIIPKNGVKYIAK